MHIEPNVRVPMFGFELILKDAALVRSRHEKCSISVWGWCHSNDVRKFGSYWFVAINVFWKVNNDWGTGRAEHKLPLNCLDNSSPFFDEIWTWDHHSFGRHWPSMYCYATGLLVYLFKLKFLPNKWKYTSMCTYSYSVTEDG